MRRCWVHGWVAACGVKGMDQKFVDITSRKNRMEVHEKISDITVLTSFIILFNSVGDAA